MRRPHDCPGDCGREVKYAHFACEQCWYRLPTRMRRSIREAHHRSPKAHRLAMYQAVIWYRHNPLQERTTT